MSSKISRGDFLKHSGLAAAGIMMGGMANGANLYFYRNCFISA